MTKTKSPRKKWIAFMTIIGWKGNTNWKQTIDSVIDQNIPEVEVWARVNLKHVDQDIRRCFKAFYWPSNHTALTQHDYTKKTQAEHALAAVYSKEQERTV